MNKINLAEKQKFNDGPKIISKDDVLSTIDFESYYMDEVESFNQKSGKVWKNGICPFHPDNDPSLSVNTETGGFNCFGCDEKGSVFDFHMKKHGLEFKPALEDLGNRFGVTPADQMPNLKKKNKNLVAEYSYTDRDGQLVFQVCRFNNPKTFRQRQPDGNGGWRWNMTGIEPFPYRLHEVVGADTVFLPEGEKDCDRIAELGLTASCNPMGAGKFKPKYANHFKNKNIVIIPDNDLFGQEHAENVAETLSGVAKSIKIVALTDLPDKGDVSDWLDAGHTKDELQALVSETKEWDISRKVEDPNPPPLDLFGDTVLVGSPEFPLDACPKVIAEYAQDCAERLGVETGMIAMPCIVATASLIPDSIQIQPKKYDTEWRESARLWCAVVAEPGDKKTPAIDMSVKHIKEIEKELFLEDQKALDEYERQLAEYERSKKKVNTPILEKPKKPPQHRKMADDTTVERLGDILVDNPNGILVLKDELSGWIGSFDAYRSNGSLGKDRSLYLELYNGGPKLIDRVKKGRMIVPNWSACILGGIQPGPMKRNMAKITDDGLIQRFMVIQGGRKGGGQDRRPQYDSLTNYFRLQSRISKADIPEQGLIITLSEGAQEERKKVMDAANLIMVLPEVSPAFKAHLSKWDGLYSRILLTFHITESFSNEDVGIPSVVMRKTAARAAKLMLNYLLPNAARFYLELIGNDKHFVHARWIAGHILAHKLEKITRREIGRAYSNLRDDEGGINRAMRVLTVSDWVKPSKWDNLNRPKWWAVDPRVHEIFAERAKQEKIRREGEIKKIQKAAKTLGMNNSGGRM